MLLLAIGLITPLSGYELPHLQLKPTLALVGATMRTYPADGSNITCGLTLLVACEVEGAIGGDIYFKMYSRLPSEGGVPVMPEIVLEHISGNYWEGTGLLKGSVGGGAGEGSRFEWDVQSGTYLFTFVAYDQYDTPFASRMGYVRLTVVSSGTENILRFLNVATVSGVSCIVLSVFIRKRKR